MCITIREDCSHSIFHKQDRKRVLHYFRINFHAYIRKNSQSKKIKIKRVIFKSESEERRNFRS